MAQVQVNVEFGKCSFQIEKEKLEAGSKEELETTEILSEEIIQSGSLYFDKHRIDGKHTPFILTPYSVNMDDFTTKIFNNWKLPLPRIVLFAVTDSEVSPSDDYRKFSRKLVKGLVHALNTTEMWLCSDGLEHGFSKDIGQEFEKEISRRKSLDKDQETKSAFPDTALIGICERNILTFSNKFGETAIDESPKKVTEAKKDINRHYEYFIFVEDTTDTKRGITKFILDFMHCMTKHGQTKPVVDAEKYGTYNSELPVMLLLLHGKVTRIDLILGHLRRGLPLVIFEGSGGLADLLAYAYYQAASRPEGANLAEYTESVLKPRVSGKVSELYSHFPDFKVSVLNEKIFDCIRYSKKQGQEFITILNLNNIEFQSSKLPHYLLKALFKSQSSESLKSVQQMKEDLFLAMDWNSASIAMDEVFARDPTGQFKIDGQTFYRALTKPHREDFVCLFLNQGFVIHTYLNSLNLVNLFKNSMNREFFKSVVWESVLGYGTNTKISSDGYGTNTDISNDFLDSKLIILIEQLTGIPSLINTSQLNLNSQGLYKEQTPEEAERKAVATLVMWAILSYRVKLVKTLWQHSEQPIHIAIACSQILRKLEAFVTDLNLKNEMQKQSLEFSIMAASVMTLCYDSVPCRALDLLKEKNSVWSHKALMEIAAFAKNKMFLAHPCCQKQLDDIFMGHIKVRDLPYGDITIPLWMKITLSSFLIFPMFLWMRFEKNPSAVDNIKENSSEETNSDNDVQNFATKVVRKRKDEHSFFKKVYMLWSAPISKFWVYQVFYVLFLTLFSLAVIWPACGNVYLDFFTCVWMVITVIDSMYHTVNLSIKYTSMPLAYKSIEIAIMIIFSFAYIMGRLVMQETFMTPYAAKVMLCIALLYFYYRLIFIALPISSDLGPLLHRVKRMITVDFSGYIRVTILVVICNGIVIHTILYPDYPLNLDLLRRMFFDAIIYFFLAPSASYYGSADPKCIRLKKRHSNKISFIGMPENVCKVGRYYKFHCPNPGVWPYIFGLQYLIILRLILLVLLFALFSNTARKLEKQGKYIWKYQRYQLITNFSNRLALPPPLCIIPLVYVMIKCMFKKLYYFVHRNVQGNYPAEDNKYTEKLDENDFRYWKSLAKQYYKKKKQEKEEETTTKKRMERISTLADGLNNQRRTLRDLEGHLNELQIQIKNAHQYLGSGLQVSVRERLQVRNVPQIFSRMSPYPKTMISRFPVSDSHVPWQNNWANYDPIAFTLPKGSFPRDLQPHVDVDIQKLLETEGESFKMPSFNWNQISVSPAGVSLDRKSWITTDKQKSLEYELDSENLPKNPLGRTGLQGRGCLPRWGPNHYVYVVITRWYVKEIFNKKLEVMLMNTSDSLGLPGGYAHTDNPYGIIQSLFNCQEIWPTSEKMVEFFKSLKEEENSVKKKSFFDLLAKHKNKEDLLDVTSERVKMGYMDDETNTDQAWCEAEVWHFHYNVQFHSETVLRENMEWYILSEDTLMKVPISQASIIHTIAKSMKAIILEA